MAPDWTKIKYEATLVAIVILLIVLPIFLIILLPLSLVLRLEAILLARAFRPDLSSILDFKATLTGLDMVITKPKVNILTLLTLEEELSLAEFRRSFEQRVLNLENAKGNRGSSGYTQLRQTCAQFMGFLFWKCDPSFDLKNHIRTYDYSSSELALPNPCTAKDVERVTGELLAAPWPEGRSPWEILFITCTDPENPSKKFTVMAVRIHHVMADGFSILKMILKAGDCQNVKVPKANFPELSPWERLLLPLAVALRLPYDFAKCVIDSFDGPNSWHLVESEKYERKYHLFVSDRIPVERLKAIRKKYSVGFNAVVYAVAIGTVRRMMMQAGQKLPERMSCAVPLPLPDHPEGLAIHISFVSFKFSPRIESAEERMKETVENFDLLRKSPTVPIVNNLSNSGVSLLPVWILRFIYDKAMTSMGMTNFPGPETPIRLLGKANVIDMLFAVGHPDGTTGVTGSMLSYTGAQRIVFTIDKAIFKGFQVPDNFPQLIEDEIKDLLGGSGASV